MAQTRTRTAVVTALVANVVVALAKLAAWLVSGSSAMLAESIHSAADSANEVLLLVGVRRARRPADARHPFGHARFRYLYAFVVSLTIFWIGGVLAVVEGVSRLAEPEPILDSRIAFAVLGVGAVLDGWSLRTSLRAGRPLKGQMTWKALVRSTKAPDLIVVLLEDLGALIGLAIAAAGLWLTTVTGDRAWDALASILIGVLLMAIGYVVNRETQSLLLGESATPAMEAAIRRTIQETAGIAKLSELRTIHVGPEDLVVAARILVDEGSNGRRIGKSIETASERVRAAVDIEHVTVFIEPRVDGAAPRGNDPPG